MATFEAGAPIRFAATLKALGVTPNTARYLMGSHPESARQLIKMMGTKADKEAIMEAIMDAFEFYLAEAGQVIYKPGPKMKN